MNLEINNNWIDNVDEKVRNSYVKSIEYIIPFDEEEKKTIEEVIEWIKNTKNITKKENPEQHLGVVAFIVNKRNKKVFLINHRKAETFLMPWGHVDFWETFQETIEKELKEELWFNVEIKNKEPFYISKIYTHWKNSWHYDVTVVFKIEIEDDKSFTVDEKEADNAKWFEWDELSNLTGFSQLPRIKDKLSVNKVILLDNWWVIANHYCEPQYSELYKKLWITKDLLKTLLSEKSPQWQAYRKNLITRDEFWDTVVKLAWGIKNIDYSILEKLWAESYHVNELIIETLKKYRNIWIKTWLISNSDKFRKKFMEDIQWYSSFLDYHIFSCDIWYMKPEISLFNHTIKEIWTSPSNIIYFDDRESHAIAARNVWINWEVFLNLEDFKVKLGKFYKNN